MALVVIVAAAAAIAQQETMSQRGRVEAVTVYRGQALVTRVIEVELAGGTTELVVTELPEHIVAGSLYATSEGDTTVRAVSFRSRAVEQEPRPEVRELQDQIEGIAATMRQIDSEAQLLLQRMEYLTKLESFSAAQAHSDLGEGTLDPEAVANVSTFIFESRETTATRLFELSERRRELAEEGALLQRRLAEIAPATTRTLREAIVFLQKGQAGAARVRLHYLVNAASWSPVYNLHSARDTEGVSVEYSALISQMSGEDWTDVTLTLSTASPNMLAEGPLLVPLAVRLTTGADGAAQIAAQIAQANKEQLALELQQARSRRSADADDQLGNDWAMNMGGQRLQLYDLLADSESLMATQHMPELEVLAANYEIDSAITLPSRAEQQMIQISALEMSGEFYHLAVPVLTPYVYHQARLVNDSEVALLAGRFNAYRDGQFVGSGQLPMVAAGQQFTIGLGVDPQLRATRELVTKDDQIRGGNRELTFEYRILIENYKDQPVALRVMDRIPDPQDGQIRVTLGETSEPISDDAQYLRTLNKMGVLRWDTEVAGHAAGESAKEISYVFTLEFDRNAQLTLPTPEEQEDAMPALRSMMMH